MGKFNTTCVLISSDYMSSIRHGFIRLLAILFVVSISACSNLTDHREISLTQPVIDALASGSTDGLTDPQEITDAIGFVIGQSESEALSIVSQLITGIDASSSGITWDPTHDSAILAPTVGTNHSVLFANDSANSTTPNNESILVAGYMYETPYQVYGGNPFRNLSLINTSMEAFLISSIQWLSGKSVEDIDQVVLAHLDDSYWFRDYPGTNDWLKLKLDSAVQINGYQECDNAALQACLEVEGVDLLVISQHMHDDTDTDFIRQQISTALGMGIPVMYLHHDGNLTSLGAEILAELDVSYVKDNYWSKLRVTDLNIAEIASYTNLNLEQIKTLINNLESGIWDFSLDTCLQNCSNQIAFQDEFLDGAQYVQSLLRRYDSLGVYIFEETDHEMEKLLTLLGDMYRKEITYPMSLDSTPDYTFLRAYYADFSQYQRRTLIPLPSDLGNFSRTDFSGVTTTDVTIDLISRVPFRAAGVYALPGQVVTVSRNDNNDVDVQVFVNTVRDGATHLWDVDGYKRPRFLRGQQMTLEPGASFSFTSTYGGPIQVAFDTNDIVVSLQFNNVGLHPFWNGSEDDLNFQQALDANYFDWAELVTPAFEVHSKTDLLQISASNPLWSSGASLASATMMYTHNYPLLLAGFQGDGIEMVDEIHDFASVNGWTIDTVNTVKHMNADQAACGYGCSGNPYDAYWSFNPVGHGDIHEVGHGLERSKFRFTTSTGATWEGHSTTNLYSYYSKSRFYQNTNEDPQCQNLPFNTLYQYLQDAAASDNASQYMAELGAMNPPAWNIGVAIYLQMILAAQAESDLTDGWNLWPRLHMAEREFKRAIIDETNWLDRRTSLGMGQISWSQATGMTNNDWMLMALSFISARNFSSFFDLYGLGYSTEAYDQTVAYPLLNPVFYGANGSDYCFGLNKSTLPVDGVSLWPY